MNRLSDMAYMRGRSDARAGLPRYPRCQHPDQYHDYNAGFRDWHKLAAAPALLAALQKALPLALEALAERATSEDDTDRENFADYQADVEAIKAAIALATEGVDHAGN